MAPSFNNNDGTRFLPASNRVPIPPPSARDTERMVREAVASGKLRRFRQGESGLIDASGAVYKDTPAHDRVPATIEGDDEWASVQVNWEQPPSP